MDQLAGAPLNAREPIKNRASPREISKFHRNLGVWARNLNEISNEIWAS